MHLLLIERTAQDRFADARALPPVDSQQDWTLVAGKEENEWTIVAFNRTLQTRDPRDRDIVQVCMHAFKQYNFIHNLRKCNYLLPIPYY